MNVPAFLEHLRRDSKGRPVPWINVWGPDEEDRFYLQDDPNASGDLAVWQRELPGDQPDFTRQCLQRQRQAVRQGLCQVCGTPAPWPRLLVWSQMSYETVTLLDGRRQLVITEPWLDTDCAAFALKRCPGLIRRRTAEDLSLIKVESIDQVELIVSRGWIDGPLEQLSKSAQPAMWAKIAIRSA